MQYRSVINLLIVAAPWTGLLFLNPWPTVDLPPHHKLWVQYGLVIWLAIWLMAGTRFGRPRHAHTPLGARTRTIRILFISIAAAGALGAYLYTHWTMCLLLAIGCVVASLFQWKAQV